MIEDKIKSNIVEKIISEGFLSCLNGKNKTNNYSGIYFLYDKNNLYIGKSVNIINRLLEHKRNIVSKTHYNKKMNTFKIKDVKYMFIECSNIDLKERYYINKFYKKLKINNIIIPSYKKEVFFIDTDKYLIKRNLNKTNLKSLNRFIYNKKQSSNLSNFMNFFEINSEQIKEEKMYLFKYINLIKDIDDIIKIEHSKATKNYYFTFKNINKIIGMSANIKKLKNLNPDIIKENINNKECYKLGFMILNK